MTLKFEEMQEVINAALASTNKRITGDAQPVRLTATQLNAMGTASTTHVWFGTVYLAATEDITFQLNTEITLTATNIIAAVNHTDANYENVLFNRVTSTAADGTYYFVGYRFQVTNL